MNGLEALKKIGGYSVLDSEDQPFHCALRKEAKKELAIIEKELKALEIIKEKQVRFPRFTMCLDFHSYNRPYLPKYKLTKEEFELLKEVMK